LTVYRQISLFNLIYSFCFFISIYLYLLVNPPHRCLYGSSFYMFKPSKTVIYSRSFFFSQLFRVRVWPMLICIFALNFKLTAIWSAAWVTTSFFHFSWKRLEKQRNMGSQEVLWEHYSLQVLPGNIQGVCMVIYYFSYYWNLLPHLREVLYRILWFKQTTKVVHVFC
jgi:hypothetical protein